MAATESEKRYFNALSSAISGEYRALSRYKEKHSSWEEAWHSLPQDVKKRHDPDAEWSRLEEKNIALLFPESFPAPLREIPLPPHALYLKGSIETIANPVAIVGTRKAKEEGLRAANDFAAHLARAGCTIISGLAFGIDAAAHKGCLDAGGRAVAVLGTDLSRYSPRSNERIAQRIVESGGAVLSEYPLGAETMLYHFLQRNRIVSGLSLGVLLVEVPERSGAMATARFAMEQNREVFVVPGRVYDKNYAGSHALIRDGAELVVSPVHILETLGLKEAGVPAASSPQTEKERAVFALIAASRVPLPIDKIAALAKLNIQDASQIITVLLISNVIKENEKGFFA